MSDAAPLARVADGDWYDALTEAFEALRQDARRACHQHATLPPDERGAMAPLLRGLFAAVGEQVFIEAPFHCAYGRNIHLADQVYMNAGCTILDSASVRIGTGTMLGPGVQIYCAEHHPDPNRRRDGIERALPVTLGKDVWICGGVTLLPGVTVGDGAVVGAGSVVNRDVAPGQRVAGVPARPL
ncbi:sugar O-acetyltransferase [Fluviibacterium sp. DFM31]|uniref:Sugar O-acetyltransferase n=1 Tax=Meridianimarinicoccus marinus TaxID=3231483 RepID=A0ABV3L0X4_9RHOB